MEQILETIKKLLELMNFDDAETVFNQESNRFSITISDISLLEDLPLFLKDFEYVVNLISQKATLERIYLDINNYRLEREKLIVELAKAAAQRAVLNKEEIQLPPLNDYERRLVHLEIANHPDLTTESVGEGRQRRVVIKLL